MIRQISADELTTMREQDLPPELLDLRSDSVFVQGSVEGAMNLPEDEPDFLTNLKKIWPHPGRLVLIAAGRDISKKVMSAIHEVGGDSVGYVEFNDWFRRNHPVRRIESISLLGSRIGSPVGSRGR